MIDNFIKDNFKQKHELKYNNMMKDNVKKYNNFLEILEEKNNYI